MAKTEPGTLSKLPERRRRFCIEYLKTLNASEAARRAGYKTRANVAGQRLMINADIKAFISKAINERLEADKESVKARVLGLWDNVSQDSEQNVRDRIKASELLAKYAGLLTERVEITGKDGAPILYEALPATAQE